MTDLSGIWTCPRCGFIWFFPSGWTSPRGCVKCNYRETLPTREQILDENEQAGYVGTD